jgi:hypothetical protein
MKEFWLTILSEAKRPQTQCLSPEGEFWVCSEASSRMVQNSFQRAKGNLGNRRLALKRRDNGVPLIRTFSERRRASFSEFSKLKTFILGWIR